jgi:type II secretory pathway component PulM
MNSYLSRLNPTERRFVVGVGVIFFLVVNIFWVWPHFSDWTSLKFRINRARIELGKREAMIRQMPRLEADVKRLQNEGNVPTEDQAVQLVNAINAQAGRSGVGVNYWSQQITRTNQYTIEKVQSIRALSGEKQLVDFLYNLGSSNSLIRVQEMSVHPDPARQQLDVSIRLVASYQKKPSGRPGTAHSSTPAVRPATPKNK